MLANFIVGNAQISNRLIINIIIVLSREINKQRRKKKIQKKKQKKKKKTRKVSRNRQWKSGVSAAVPWLRSWFYLLKWLSTKRKKLLAKGLSKKRQVEVRSWMHKEQARLRLVSLSCLSTSGVDSVFAIKNYLLTSKNCLPFLCFFLCCFWWSTFI